MSKRVKKTVLIIFLLFVAVGISLYSYLNLEGQKYLTATELNLTANEVIEVNRTLSHDPSKSLVPKGAILGIDDVDEVKYSYLVNLDNTDELTLDVSVNNLLIGNSDVY